MASVTTGANTAGTIEQAVHAALATVDDPEIHRPITELGMVKSVVVVDGVADIGVYLTVVGCPMREADHQAGHRRRVARPGDHAPCASSWT